jgi:DNA-binding FrmR family transcriptional regulator
MLDEGAQKDLELRLSRISGQLEGLKRMVQEPRRCVDILQQVASAEAALKAVGDKIIQFHVEHCFAESLGQDSSNLQQQTRELVEITMRYRGR